MKTLNAFEELVDFSRLYERQIFCNTYYLQCVILFSVFPPVIFFSNEKQILLLEIKRKNSNKYNMGDNIDFNINKQ